ncbi:hypothetical protein L484_003552 [Morus notabilis]|uniref:Uncharacterized protein n=1 Tax=Morus notabilis TaxID=981085 RepID=W9QI81_9ROSA|nr:hypothetical protein L484_003552 [Morus notabilis]
MRASLAQLIPPVDLCGRPDHMKTGQPMRSTGPVDRLKGLEEAKAGKGNVSPSLDRMRRVHSREQNLKLGPGRRDTCLVKCGARLEIYFINPKLSSTSPTPFGGRDRVLKEVAPRRRLANQPAQQKQGFLDAIYAAFQGMATRAQNERPVEDRKQGDF